jgi:hypothetical protein
MVETTYQTTKYQTPGTITEIYSREIGNTQYRKIKTEIYMVVG